MRAYLDYNATAPLDQKVREIIVAHLLNGFGNPASSHEEGRASYDAVERARMQIATAVNCRSDEISFTSSGTESNNTIIKGFKNNDRYVILTSAIEHPCVRCAARAMTKHGYTFMPIAVDDQGLLDFDDLEKMLKNGDVGLVSVMLANNESGVIQDVERVVKLSHEHGALVHTDAAQALGKITVDFKQLGVDAMTLSSHKARGPMGMAALILKAGMDINPLLEGGGQESGKRSGTLNVSGIVGFGAAAQIAIQRLAEEFTRLQGLQQLLEKKLVASGALIFGANAKRLPNTTYFGFPNIDGEALLLMLDQSGFAVASGAACASTKNEPSHVLLAMGLDELTARTAVRCSLGFESEEEQVLKFAQTTIALVTKLSSMAAVIS